MYIMWGLPTAAQSDDALEKLRRCAAIEDETARHACYDEALRSDGGAPVPAATAENESPATYTEPVVPPVDTRAPVDTRSEAELVREDFGREAKKKREPKSIEVVVIEATVNARGRYIYRTEDGQLWRQIDTNDPYYRRFPVAAQIKKGLMGTYFIKVEGVAGKVRVRRIN